MAWGAKVVVSIKAKVSKTLFIVSPPNGSFM